MTQQKRRVLAKVTKKRRDRNVARKNVRYQKPDVTFSWFAPVFWMGTLPAYEALAPKLHAASERLKAQRNADREARAAKA